MSNNKFNTFQKSDKKVGNNSKSYQLVTEEKGFGGELSTLGKLAYFTEYFDSIKISDQDIQSLIPIENPRETTSFKSGYERGRILVEQGFTKEHYHNFLESLRKKPKEKIEELQNRNKKHR